MDPENPHDPALAKWHNPVDSEKENPEAAGKNNPLNKVFAVLDELTREASEQEMQAIEMAKQQIREWQQLLESSEGQKSPGKIPEIPLLNNALVNEKLYVKFLKIMDALPEKLKLSDTRIIVAGLKNIAKKDQRTVLLTSKVRGLNLKLDTYLNSITGIPDEEFFREK